MRADSIAGMPGKLLNTIRLAAVACVLAIAGCGGDDGEGTIPPDAAEALLAELAAVESNVRQGDCDAARDGSEAFAGTVNELPGEVDPDVRSGLVRASSNLVELIESDCEEAHTGASGEEGVVPAPEVPTTPAPVVEEPAPEAKPEKEEKPEKEPEPEDDEEGSEEGSGGGPPGGTPPGQSGGVGAGGRGDD